MPFVLALDQGTTSSRAILFDRDGAVRASSQREFTQRFPREGWVEHDPDEIVATQFEVAREAIRAAGIAPADVAAVGITNQRETTVVWDRSTGRPIAPAVVWQDRRTADACRQLREAGHEQRVRERTGLVLDPYFSATKIGWLLDNVSGARARAERGELAFGTMDSWLVWHLTGGGLHVTDPSNASRTLLCNLRTAEWDDDLLALFGIPRSMLPDIVPSSGVCGTCSPDILGAAIPIAGIAGDQQAALFGQRCTRPGQMKNTYGTGCFMLLNTGGEPVLSRHGLLTTIAWKIGGDITYALEGSVFAAGAVVQWLGEGLGLFDRAEDVETLAASVRDSGDVMLVPAFTGLGAPYWDPYARGLLVGMTRGTTRAHLARAALESIALQTVDVVRAMERDSGLRLTELRADGGASRNDLLLQIQADLAGADVVRPAVTESTALGAAFLAGLAIGIWDSTGDLEPLVREDRRFTPALSDAQAAGRLARWHRAVERSRAWIEPDEPNGDGPARGD